VRRRAALPCAALALLALGSPAARADIFHLKNGATISADSWEERGDQVVIHQRSGTIVVPRADIARIESEAAATPPTAAEATPARDQAGPTTEQILARLEELKRRLRDYPLARAENLRQIVALLDRLGAEAYRGRDYDTARQRFGEALQYDEHDVQAQLGTAAAYLALEQDVYARTTLERALLDHPGNADLLALLGDVYNSEERPEDALEAWQKAYAVRPDASLKAKIDRLQRQHAIEGTYRRSEAAHFTLKYDGEKSGPDLEGQIVDTLEGRFSDLVNRFDYLPRQPIVVIVYPQRQFYEATQAESNVAGLYDGKIRVPIGGLTALTPEARKVLIHELAHAFIAGRSGRTAPRWLHEGLAQLIEGKTTAPAQGIPLAKEYRSLEDKSTWGTNFSYPSALSFVEFLVERHGFPVVVDALQGMSEGLAPDAAFEKATRDSLAELRKAWGEALVTRYLQ
jgi:tetratricopeptide (TPR) repeat protein